MYVYDVSSTFSGNPTFSFWTFWGHIERDCFKRKRDAEQGIVKPVSKNVEKQEQTETTYSLITANKRKRDGEQSTLKLESKNVEKQEQRETVYGLIAADRNNKIKICSNCMNEVQEEKNVKTLGLILSNVTKQPANPQDKENWIGDSGATVHIKMTILECLKLRNVIST